MPDFENIFMDIVEKLREYKYWIIGFIICGFVYAVYTIIRNYMV